MIRVCSFLFITYFLHNNIQEDWLLYKKKNTFNSAHTKQSATSEITTTQKKTDKEKFKIQTGKRQ